MKVIAIDSIQGGEVLAESIMNAQKNVLIPSGTVLKKEYVPLIETFGIVSLRVEDPYEAYESPNPIIGYDRLEALVCSVQDLLEKHIYHGQASLKEFEIIAHEIVREVNQISDKTVFDMNERTPNLYEHTVMVTLLSTIIAKKMHMDITKQYNIALGCLLHDIGIRYVTVPYMDQNIEELDATSVFEYKKHTILGYTAVEDEQWIPNISKKMILTHHELMDGSGFPMHQRVKEMECKILQACDAFDKMISGMECTRINVCAAIDIMQEEAGIKYEEKVVKNLISIVAKYPVGTKVKMTEQKNGVVIAQTKNALCPVIMVLDTEDNQLDKEKCLNLMEEKDISILQVV